MSGIRKGSVLLATALVLLLAGPALAGGAPARIVSLAPQMTEILFAIGLGDRVIGVSTHSDYPPEAREKARIGGMSNPSLEAIVSLKPDMVAMSTDGNRKEVRDRLTSFGIPTYVFRARRVRELPAALRDVGATLGNPREANALADEIETALAAFEGRRRASRADLTALFVIWPEPLVIAGPDTSIDDAFGILGLTNLAANAGIQYPKYSIEEIVVRDPDIIFVGSNMGVFDSPPGESTGIPSFATTLLGKLRTVRAVRDGRVYFPGDALYRLGPRTVAGIRELEGFLAE